MIVFQGNSPLFLHFQKKTRKKSGIYIAQFAVPRSPLGPSCPRAKAQSQSMTRFQTARPAAKFIILKTKLLVFDTQFLVFYAEFISFTHLCPERRYPPTASFTFHNGHSSQRNHLKYHLRLVKNWQTKRQSFFKCIIRSSSHSFPSDRLPPTLPALKMMNSVFQMMNFVISNDEFCNFK